MTRPDDDVRAREREFRPVPHQLRFVRLGAGDGARPILALNGEREWPSLHVARAMAEHYLVHEKPDPATLVVIEVRLGPKRTAAREAWAWSPLQGAHRVIDYHETRVA